MAAAMMEMRSRDFGIGVVDACVSLWCGSHSFVTFCDSGADEIAGGMWQCRTVLSQPVQETPVAQVVIHLRSEVKLLDDTGNVHLDFTFEDQDLIHHWAGAASILGYHVSVKWAVKTHVTLSHFLDCVMDQKQAVRGAGYQNLSTDFEASRRQPPETDMPDEAESSYSDMEPSSEEEMDFIDVGGRKKQATDVDRQRMRAALEAAGLPLDFDDITTGALLMNVFEASDENSEGVLTHKEVADLLQATLGHFGLTEWDTRTLLTMANETDDGFIEYKPFTQAAPELIEAAQKRRALYNERRDGVPAEVTPEAITVTFGDELAETSRLMVEACVHLDPNDTGAIRRDQFRRILYNRHDRLSPQEIQMLLQYAPEDDIGNIQYTSLPEVLEQLRIDCIHNALVETDVKTLRTQLILLLRRQGLTADAQFSPYILRNVLLAADQICISRRLIFVILGMVSCNHQRMCDAHEFIQVACSVIAHLYDTEAFVKIADRLTAEGEAAQKQRELDELNAMVQGMSKQRAADDEEEEEEESVMDREQVEKHLIQYVFSLKDEKHRATLEWTRFYDAMQSPEAQQVQFSEQETRAFVANANVDENGEVAYVEHVRTWVPIIFELRKSAIYEPYMNGMAFDLEQDGLKLRDMVEFEGEFPLLPPEMRATVTKDQKGSRSSRRRDSNAENSLPRLVSRRMSGSVRRLTKDHNYDADDGDAVKRVMAKRQSLAARLASCKLQVGTEVATKRGAARRAQLAMKKEKAAAAGKPESEA
mmetsp:Transcript_8163/g.20152  ORF Transcript_8163/g.20152 Transcript_8163/m.20152 type:complete len:762 (-) Transcript_8163:294-2579(-)